MRKIVFFLNAIFLLTTSFGSIFNNNKFQDNNFQERTILKAKSKPAKPVMPKIKVPKTRPKLKISKITTKLGRRRGENRGGAGPSSPSGPSGPSGSSKVAKFRRPKGQFQIRTLNDKQIKKNKQIDNSSLNNFINMIKFYGLDNNYKGEIKLDTSNHKIIFSSDTSVFHSYFNNQLYNQVIIKDEEDNIIKIISIMGNDSMQDVVKKYDLQNGISYNENYSIFVWSAEEGRTDILSSVVSWNTTDTEIKFDDIIVFNGINTKYKFGEYKGEINFDLKNRKLLFFGNYISFHNYYENKLYNQITIKDENDNIIKIIPIMGNDSMQDIIKKYDLQDGLYYQKDYSIELWSVEPHRLKLLNPNSYNQKISINSTVTDEIKFKKVVDFYGLDNDYNGKINYDLKKQKLIFSGNDTWFHNNYENKLYNRITIEDESNIVIKDIKIMGNNSMQDVIKKYDLQDGISCQKNYSIYIWSAEPEKTELFSFSLRQQEIKILDKASFNNIVILNGIDTSYNFGEYKGKIGFDSDQNKLLFFGNSMPFHDYYRNGLYSQIIIRDENNNNIIRKISIRGNESMQDVIKKYNLQDGISYQKGYSIFIETFEPNRVKVVSALFTDVIVIPTIPQVNKIILKNFSKFFEKKSIPKSLDVNNRIVILSGLNDLHLRDNGEYKGEIKYDLDNQKLLFSGNDIWFNHIFKGQIYNQIVIKDENDNIFKKIKIMGDQSMQDVIKKYDLQDGIPYKKDYSIEIWSVEPERTEIIATSSVNISAINMSNFFDGAFLRGENAPIVAKTAAEIRKKQEQIVNFYGLNDKHKGEIKFDLKNQKLIFDGNDEWLHYYRNELYNQIIIKDENNIIVRQINILGHESMQDIIKKYNLQDGIPYKKDYSIYIWSVEPNRTKILYSNLKQKQIGVNIIDLSTFNDIIIFNGIKTGYNFGEYKGKIGVDYYNNKLLFFGNNMPFHDYFANQLYVQITIKDKNKNVLKLIKIMGDQSMQDVIRKYDLQDGIFYNAESCQIFIWAREPDRVNILGFN